MKHIHIILTVLLSGASLHAQEFRLGESRIVPDPKPTLPPYDYAPDGHYTVLRTGDQLTMFWPAHESYRTVGSSIFEMHDCTKVLPMGGAQDFDNGGRWLFAVFPREGQHMIGFYHAEDQKFSGTPETKWIAYKSIARCTSDDGGATWKPDAQILTAFKPKPTNSAWSGLGDHSAIWDEKSHRYFCFFQEDAILCMAVSDDPEGRAGTWKKWYEGGFTEPGLGGRTTPIPAFAHHRGGNPSAIWNTFLRQWVLAWHTWAGDLWISTSKDLVAWTEPKLLLKKPSDNGKVWYPTFIGESDKVGGETVLLLYAEFTDAKSARRNFTARELTFLKPRP